MVTGARRIKSEKLREHHYIELYDSFFDSEKAEIQERCVAQ